MQTRLPSLETITTPPRTMEYQQAVVRAPRMSRINWTQTTTITIAAFLGCLAAMALLFYLYRSFLGKSIRERMARLDQLDSHIDEQEGELQDLNLRIESARRRTVKPVSMPPRTGMVPKPDQAGPDEEGENDDHFELEQPKGDPISLIAVV